MAKPSKRTIRLIKAPWLSLRGQLRRRKTSLKLGKRRRRSGILLLVILSGLIGLYFYLTNPANLRTSAQHYLERMVNGRVEVGRASFGFARGIKLADIRILTRSGTESAEVVFTAGNINLKINWMTLLTGRFAATQISAFRPQVFLVEDSTGHWNYEGLFVTKDFEMTRPLPKIILREGQIHYAEQINGKEIPGGAFDFTADFDPSASQGRYFGQIETTQSGRPVALVRGHFDTISGTFSKITAQINLTGAIRRSLPRRARAWMNKYNISGQLTVSGEYAPKAETRIVANLEGVACRLPLSETTSIEVSDVYGQLQFTDQGVTLGSVESAQPQPLRLKALGADWGLSGQVFGYQSQPDFDLQIDCRELVLPRDPDLTNALPKVYRNTLRDWNPTGKISLQVNIARSAGDDPPIRTLGYIRCLDVNGSFRYFPYSLENINGLIQISPQRTKLEYMTAIHRSRSDPSKVVNLAAEGEIVGPSGTAEANITITAENLILDDELRQVLRPKKQAQWDLFNPTGTASATFQLNFKADRTPKWQTRIEGLLNGVDVTFKDFPYALSQLHGRIYIGLNHIEIGSPGAQPAEDSAFVSGLAGKAPVRFRCLINNPQQDDQSVRLEFAADGLMLDEQLAQALPPRARRLFDVFSPSGPANVSGVISTSKGSSDSPDFLIDLQPMDITSRHQAFPYPLEHGRGHIRLSPGRFELLDFSAQHAQASFTGRGLATSDDGVHYQADISITGRDIPLDEAVYNSLQPQQQQIWDALQPEGKCDVNIAITDDAEGLLTYKAQVIPRGVTINYKHLPYTLRNLTGQLIVQPGLIDVNMHDAQRNTSISGQLEQQGEKQFAKFTVSAKDVALDEQFKEVLPANARAIWETVSPAGRIDVRIDSLSYLSGASGAAQWAGKGSVALKGLTLSKPVSCQNLSGSISGSLQSGQDGPQLDFQGQLALPQLSLGPLRLKNLSGLFSKSSMAEKWSLTDIRADLAGGRLLGGIETTKAASGEFSATLQAEDVQLAQLITDFESANPNRSPADSDTAGSIQGRLRASIKLEGKFSDSSSTSGRGRIYIDRAQLYRLPLMMRILQTLSLQSVDPNAFNTATVDFYLRDNNIIFTEIIMEGPSLRMVGTGLYDKPKDSLNVVMVREPPQGVLSNLPPLPESVIAEISGSLADPKVRARPFRSISEELKKLFRKRKPHK